MMKRKLLAASLFRVLFPATLAVASIAVVRAVSLQLEHVVGGVQVRWPTNATGFTLRIADRMPPTDGWRDISDNLVVADDHFTWTDRSGAVGRFFRLFKGQGEPPILSMLTVTTNRITRTNHTALQFNYHDPECDIAFMQLVIRSGLGASTQLLAAPNLGLNRSADTASLELIPFDLALGFNSVAVSLIDQEGRISSPAFVNVALLGDESGGSSPVVTDFAALENPLRRPGNVNDGVSRRRPPFRLATHDPDGDIARVRFRLFGPPGNLLLYGREYAPERLGMTPAGGATVVHPIEVTSSTTPGDYLLSCQVFDRANNLTVQSNINIRVAAVPPHPIQIFSPTPRSGGPGTIVRLPVGGLDPNDTNAITLSLGPLELPILTNDAQGLFAEIPVGARTDRFLLRTTNLVVASASVFDVPTHLTVAPAFTHLLPAESTRFFLESHTNAPPPPLTWRVDGVPGGSEPSGTISTAGKYRAPDAAMIPSNRIVSITATLDTDTNIMGQAQVELTPAPANPGTNRFPAAVGGRVQSILGGASVTIAPGSIDSDTSISIRRLIQSDYPVAPEGRRLIAAVELGPDGLVFSEPAALSLPLDCHCPPGSVLPLLRLDPGNGRFVDEGVTAVVTENGFDAIARIPHFSVWAIPTPERVADFGPAIHSWESAVPLEEGRTVPVRLTGTGLDPATVVTVRSGGGGPVVPGFHVDSWLGKQTSGGFVVTIPVIRDLDEGASRDFEFSLIRPGQPAAAVPFTVVGLDELTVPAGVKVTYTDPSPRKWSEVYVAPGGTVRLESGVIDWQVTGTTLIEGTLDASGNTGANGNGIHGGAAGRNGGRGMRGRDDTFGVDFDPEPPRGDGDRVVPGGRTRYPQGEGGRRGDNISGFRRAHIGDLLADCYADTENRGCGPSINELFEYDRYEDFDYGFDSDSLPSGWTGFGAPRHSRAQPRPVGGHGGGGGGGSGEVRAGFDSGGGGGAGGDGGLGVRLIGRSEIHVRGLVTTDGGRGGQGVRATDGQPQIVGETRLDRLVLSGGGGGGGGAGELIAVSGGGVFHRTVGGRMSSRGGEPGDGGVVIYDASEIRGRPVVFRGLGPPPDGAPGQQYVDGPPFTPAVLRDTVTERSLIQLTETRPLGRAPLEIEIHGEQPGQVRTARIVPSNNPEFEVFTIGRTTIQPAAAPPYRLNLLLFPGFNTIAIRPDPVGGNEGSIANPIYELVFKRILSMPGPDSDGDGISDQDELDLGTDPNSADTDMDGAADGVELLAGDDPVNADSDGDCVPDPIERMLGTSPRLLDSDADQVADGIEWILGSDPVSLPPGVTSHCPVTTGPPAGILFGQVRGKAGGFRLAMIDLTRGRAGAVGSPDRGFGFGMDFNPNGTLLLAMGSRLAEASEAYCLEPFNNFASRIAVGGSGRRPAGASRGSVSTAGTPFVGGVLFGPSTGGYTRRIDPLAIDLAGNLPVTDLSTFEIGGVPIQTAAIAYLARFGSPRLIGVVLDSSTLTPTGQLFMHTPRNSLTSLLGNPFDRPIKAIAGFMESGRIRLLGVAEGSPEDELVELSPGGGPNVRVIGALGHDEVWGLARHPNGNLYASAITSTAFNPSSDILLVDPVTAIPTRVASYPKEIFNITFAPCPVPCFGPGLRTATWPGIRHLTAVDFDKDGDDDLAMVAMENANSLAATLVLMRSDGLGGFQLPTSHVMGGSVFDATLQIEIADLDNDTWPDLVCKNPFAQPAGVVVAMNDGAGGYPAIQLVPTASDPTAMDVGDLTGDSVPDLLIALRGRIELFEGNGDGTFAAGRGVVSLFPNDEATSLRIDDFNNDRLNDFVFAAFFDQRTELNNGAGGFTSGFVASTIRDGRIDVADINDDGSLDLIVNSRGTGLAVYPGSGSGDFRVSRLHRFETSLGAGLNDFLIAELDGDGLPDAVVFSTSEKTVHLWLNQRGTDFTPARQSPLLVDGPAAIAVGDFDGDGAPDLAVGESIGGVPNQDHVKVLLGN